MQKVELHICETLPDKTFFKSNNIRIALLHYPKQRYENSLAILRFKDLLTLSNHSNHIKEAELKS